MSAVLDDAAPCATCRHSARCDSEKLGCHALVLFTRGLSRERIKFAPRQPTVALLVEALRKVPKAQRKRVAPTPGDLFD